MADRTSLEEKLAEVTGLAGAAQDTTKKVESMLNGNSLAETPRQMREEAEETEETKNEATETMRIYPAIAALVDE